MDQDLKEILIVIAERLRSLEEQSDQESITLNQIALTLQGTPIAEALKSYENAAILSISKRRGRAPHRVLDDIIQRLKAL